MGRPINPKIQKYILILEKAKDEIENDLLIKEVDFERKKSLEIQIALGYIRAAINALYLTEDKK